MRKMTFFIALFVCSIFLMQKIEATNTVYNINPNSNTFGGVFKNYSTYNQNTKHYYLIRSYLEQLEKKKGGTLVLQKGTYNITNVLYVPSNVTIKMQNGVVLKKGTATGTTFGASKSMFQLIAPSKSGKTGVVGGYNGEKNITFIGEGQVKIDMNFMKDGIAIIAGHNQNIRVQNIEFHNMRGGHFLEVDASKGVAIRGNKFLNSKATTENMKEAINLDTPDKLTEGWSQAWSNYDKTANDNVVIEYNKFQNIDVAIGTHNYSQNKPHKNIVIRNNEIEGMRTNGISVMNWENAVIENNVIKNVTSEDGRAVLVRGSNYPTIKNNKFQNVARPIQFMVWKNEGKASGYPAIYNKLSATNIKDLATNTLEGGKEGHIRMNTIYNDYTNKTVVYPLEVISLTTNTGTRYISNPGGKAYKTDNKNGGYYRTYQTGEEIKVYYQGNNWYYGFVKNSSGKNVRYYFHEDEVQGTKPIVYQTLYVKEGGAKVYAKNSKDSELKRTLDIGTKLTMEYIGNSWFRGTIYLPNTGTKEKLFIHGTELQSKSIVAKNIYISEGGANAYKEKIQNDNVLRKVDVGTKLSMYYVGDNWYTTKVMVGGQKKVAYFHEDEVQGKALTPKDLYTSEGGAKVYESKNKNSEVLREVNVGNKIRMTYVGNNWYNGVVVVDGERKHGYFHEDHVQGKVLLAKKFYVSKGGANAYDKKDKNSEALKTVNEGTALTLAYLGNNWYNGSVWLDGKFEHMYFHEDNIQGKPL